jgi:hypothetical protein
VIQTEELLDVRSQEITPLHRRDDAAIRDLHPRDFEA